MKVELIPGRPWDPFPCALGQGRAAPGPHHGGRPVPFPWMYRPPRFHIRLFWPRPQALLLFLLLLPAAFYFAAVRFCLHLLILRPKGGFLDDSKPLPVWAGCLVWPLPGPGPACLSLPLLVLLPRLAPAFLPWSLAAPWPGRDLLDNGDRLAVWDKAGNELFLGEDFTSNELLLGEYLSNKSLLCNHFTRTTLLLDMSLSSVDPVDTPALPTAVASAMVMMMKPVC